VWLSVWSEVQIVCQLMPLHPKTPSTLDSFKSRLVLPFWYRLTWVVPDKGPLNWYVCLSFIDKLIFYLRVAMLARVIAMALSIHLSQVSVLSKWMNESSWLLAWKEASFHVSYTVF